jgi:hypothetical protein
VPCVSTSRSKSRTFESVGAQLVAIHVAAPRSSLAPAEKLGKVFEKDFNSATASRDHMKAPAIRTPHDMGGTVPARAII